MNERIKELAEQANLSADKTYQFDPKDGFQIQEWDKIRLEKFAELIVKECASLFDPDLRDEHEEWVIRKSILNHFGVEE